MTSVLQPRRGFTLLEVLVAAMILGVGFTVVLSASSRCLESMRRAKDFQDAMWAIETGSRAHSLLFAKDIREEGVDGEVYGRMTFRRVIEEDGDKDGLYVVRSIAEWGLGARPAREEVAEFYYQPEEKEP
jgi:prepilin-type N-terminal cleavage/methylation domain-containing protein